MFQNTDQIIENQVVEQQLSINKEYLSFCMSNSFNEIQFPSFVSLQNTSCKYKYFLKSTFYINQKLIITYLNVYLIQKISAEIISEFSQYISKNFVPQVKRYSHDVSQGFLEFKYSDYKKIIQNIYDNEKPYSSNQMFGDNQFFIEGCDSKYININEFKAFYTSVNLCINIDVLFGPIIDQCRLLNPLKENSIRLINKNVNFNDKKDDIAISNATEYILTLDNGHSLYTKNMAYIIEPMLHNCTRSMKIKSFICLAPYNIDILRFCSPLAFECIKSFKCCLQHLIIANKRTFEDDYNAKIDQMWVEWVYTFTLRKIKD